MLSTYACARFFFLGHFKIVRNQLGFTLGSNGSNIVFLDSFCIIRSYIFPRCLF
jgi:hypothetical protein